MDMSDFEKWVYKEYKLNLSAYKSNQLHRRINSLIQRVGAKSIDEYIKILKEDPVQKQKLLDFITINVTEFFRNPDIFQELKVKLKDYYANRSEPLKIWSAACSIGAEPYSLAMILDDIFPGKRHQILATDIDDTILARARQGEYTEAEIKNIEDKYLKKYFTKNGDKFCVANTLKNMISFKKHDLILDKYESGFDLIVCRNVVIYFNTDTKDEIYRKFSNALNKGGLLFVGATESIYDYKDYGFEKASTFIYRKL
ncbi:MAG: CheR family methyltransferase [Solirubrobacterales bacterium]